MIETISSNRQIEAVQSEDSEKSDSFRYWAFISYSRNDAKCAQWLHRTLERYRIPRELVGRASRDTCVPRRIYPIFRDEEELPATSDLGATLRDALAASRYLIVICSQHSIRSKWVKEEIRYFSQLRGTETTLYIIAPGSPTADTTDSSEVEYFSDVLTQLTETVVKSEGHETEPLYVDIRPGKDIPRDAVLRLIAGMLDITYDTLKQRDKIWRKRRAILATVTSILILAVISILFTGMMQERQRVVTARLGEQRYQDVAQNLKEKWIGEGLVPSPLIDAVLMGDISAAKKALDEGGKLNKGWGRINSRL